MDGLLHKIICKLLLPAPKKEPLNAQNSLKKFISSIDGIVFGQKRFFRNGHLKIKKLNLSGIPSSRALMAD